MPNQSREEMTRTITSADFIEMVELLDKQKPDKGIRCIKHPDRIGVYFDNDVVCFGCFMNLWHRREKK